MTAQEFKLILNQIPENASIESDSGWECGPSDCDRAFYNRKENRLVLTQLIGDSRYCDVIIDDEIVSERQGNDWTEIFAKG